MASKKIQLYTDRDKTIEASPETSANCVILSDGNDLQKVLDNDLTTPTVVHEETNFKVGVGDVNVSSSVVDGEVGRMVIKGKTYQNILPEPSLRNSMTNGKSMQKLNEGYENVSVVDGVAKSAILKGVTKYRDKDTGEILEAFEEGRNLELVSVKMPVLTTTSKNFMSSEMELGNFITSDGSIFDNINWQRSSDFIALKGSSQYQLNDTTYGKWFLFYDKNKNFIGSVFARNGQFITPQNCVFVKFAVETNDLSRKWQIELGNTITEYEPHKTNILTVNEDVTLRGIGNVQDTLDVLTGEVVGRVGEIVLDGSEDEVWTVSRQIEINGVVYGQYYLTSLVIPSNNYMGATAVPTLLCDKGVTDPFNGLWMGGSIKTISLRELNGKYHLCMNFPLNENIKLWLQQNHMTLYYQLEKESIKTVDLSSFGNWEKVVLDGSDDEGWGKTESTNSNTKSLWFMPNTEQLKGGAIFCDKLPTTTSGDSIGVRNSKSGGIYIHIDKTETLGVREWVAKNSPLTIWYQTTTSQANSIKEMLSFSNGHIQLSSEEGSLIPSLDYEVPTSNSYHMDLMKEGTYTMKCESCNGSLNFLTQNLRMLGTNKTFEVQSVILREDKLVMLEGSWTNPMIIEGDVTSVTLPYFTGIKSSFEGESKIEVLSTGKNLFDISKLVKTSNFYAEITENSITLENKNGGNYSAIASSQPISLKKGRKYTVSFNGKILSGNTMPEPYMTLRRKTSSGTEYYRDISLSSTPHTFTASGDDVVIPHVYSSWSSGGTNKVEYSNITIEETANIKDYEPYKSNVSKIPLLSPLRSLPNGVCDELIIDRMKKKATLIQRVGYVTLGQGDGWGSYDNVGDTMKVGRSVLPHAKSNGGGMSALIPYTFNSVSQPNEGVYIYRHASSSEARVRLKLKRTGRHDVVGMQNWLRNNNIVTLYELETPIVTEIDLEGFPLVYKDGHIFLNSEIAPVVEIAYNVNQTQQIQANNETLQRHELDILDLDNLIVSFVNAEYNLRLLKFDMELSMMALAE